VWREVRGVSLIHNERTKLLALALNTAATSAFAVGVLAQGSRMRSCR
jgi:hypothetical protein